MDLWCVLVAASFAEHGNDVLILPLFSLYMMDSLIVRIIVKITITIINLGLFL